MELEWDASSRMSERALEQSRFIIGDITCTDQTTVERKNDLVLTWVQCEKIDCLKWRRIANTELQNIASMPWHCSMNSDPMYNSCQQAEEQVDSSVQEAVKNRILTYVTSCLPVGSLVWAKMHGYCRWPGMLVIDPRYGTHVEYDSDGDVIAYHVEFFGLKHSHCWIGDPWIEVYGTANSVRANRSKRKELTKYKGSSVKAAVKEANEWLLLSPNSRLKRSTVYTAEARLKDQLDQNLKSRETFDCVSRVCSKRRPSSSARRVVSGDHHRHHPLDVQLRTDARKPDETRVQRRQKIRVVNPGSTFNFRKTSGTVKRGALPHKSRQGRTLLMKRGVSSESCAKNDQQHTKKRLSSKAGSTVAAGRKCSRRENKLRVNAKSQQSHLLNTANLDGEAAAVEGDVVLISDVLAASRNNGNFRKKWLSIPGKENLDRVLTMSVSLLEKTKEEKYLQDLETYKTNSDKFAEDLFQFMESNDRPVTKLPCWNGKPISPFALFVAVYDRGGYNVVCQKQLWCSVYRELTCVPLAKNVSVVKAYYTRNILPYELYLNGNEYGHLMNSSVIDSAVNGVGVAELIDDVQENDQSSTADVRGSAVVNAADVDVNDQSADVMVQNVLADLLEYDRLCCCCVDSMDADGRLQVPERRYRADQDDDEIRSPMCDHVADVHEARSDSDPAMVIKSPAEESQSFIPLLDDSSGDRQLLTGLKQLQDRIDLLQQNLIDCEAYVNEL